MPHLSVSLAMASKAPQGLVDAMPAELGGSGAPNEPGTPPVPAERQLRQRSLPDLDSLSDSDSSSSDDSDEEDSGCGRAAGRKVGGGRAPLPAATAAAVAAIIRSEAGKAEAAVLVPSQPAAWMSAKCHWERAEALPSAAQLVRRQSVELVHCSNSSTSCCPGRAGAAKAGAAEEVVEPDAAAALLPLLPPEIALLLPSGTGLATHASAAVGANGDDATAVVAATEELRSQLAASQAAYRTVVRALHRKSQECESLTGVVRDLTVDRARSSAGRLQLQERCGALLGDIARLTRVADQARRGQATSRVAADAAETAKMEAEGDAATAARRNVSLEEQNAELASQCEHLRRRVATLEYGFAVRDFAGGSPPNLLTPCRLAESY